VVLETTATCPWTCGVERWVGVEVGEVNQESGGLLITGALLSTAITLLDPGSRTRCFPMSFDSATMGLAVTALVKEVDVIMRQSCAGPALLTSSASIIVVDTRYGNFLQNF